VAVGYEYRRNFPPVDAFYNPFRFGPGVYNYRARPGANDVAVGRERPDDQTFYVQS
jgi:hypothetical protein